MSKKQGVTISRDSGGSSDLWYRRAYDLVRPSADRPERNNNMRTVIVAMALAAVVAYEFLVVNVPPPDDRHGVGPAQAMVTKNANDDAVRRVLNRLPPGDPGWLVASDVKKVDGVEVHAPGVKGYAGLGGESPPSEVKPKPLRP